MKTFLLTLLSVVGCLTGFAQTQGFTMPPYRASEQTIGETFIVNPSEPDRKKHIFIEDKDGKKLSDLYDGRSLKFVKFEGIYGYLVDSVGNEFKTIFMKDQLSDVTPLIDFKAAQQLENKTFWLNLTKVYLGPAAVSRNSASIKNLRFTRVTILKATLSGASYFPFALTLKTATGEIGNTYVYLSGTNGKEPGYAFTEKFLSEDPKLKYHFTPAVWKMVQAGYTDIGMPMDAFELVMGSPNDIHSTKTAKGTTQQWVYGTSFYYFENGKLTAIQR